MSSRSAWEYRLYFSEWMRQQKFEQDRQDAIWQRAKDFPPKLKERPPTRRLPPSSLTDIVFGFLLLVGSVWFCVKVYQHFGSMFLALSVSLSAASLLDLLYHKTSLGTATRLLIRLGVATLMVFSLLGNVL